MPRSARKTSLESRTARAHLPMRRAPYFVKIAKGLRLGYYRGSAAGTWIGRRYRGGGSYNTVALGLADDLTDADGSKVFNFWQAQSVARQWAEKLRLIDEGIVRGGPYTVADAVHDYLDAVRAEKGPKAEQGAKYIFNASILPELGLVLVEKLTTDRLLRWRNSLATRPKRVRTKRAAERSATREIPDDDDARRKRKATANRILTMLKAAFNRAFQAGRLPSDLAWRRVKPFAKVDEAVVRYLTAEEARRLISCCQLRFSSSRAGSPVDRVSLFRTDTPQGGRIQRRQRNPCDPAEQGQSPSRHTRRGRFSLLSGVDPRPSSDRVRIPAR